MGVPFIEFLAPGILMMTVIQNAFANTSSSIVIAKVQGNIVDTLMPPLSPGNWWLGYLAGGIRARASRGRGDRGRALMAGAGDGASALAAAFVVGSALLGALGIVAAILSNKFDQMAAITNFIVTPLSFLSGTFYTIEALPPGCRRSATPTRSST
jgi:ABC-2 type transport system permease protein